MAEQFRAGFVYHTPHHLVRGETVALCQEITQLAGHWSVPFLSSPGLCQRLVARFMARDILLILPGSQGAQLHMSTSKVGIAKVSSRC